MASWSFVHAADIHLGSPRSYRYDPSRNENWAMARRQMEEIGPDFILIGGDVTYDGNPHEHELQLAKDDFETLPWPHFVIPGNMEVGNKPHPAPECKVLNVRSDTLRLFALYFGPLNWSFVYRNVRVTGFYAAVAGSGLREEEMFWHFMERLPALPPAGHHVAMMHYALFTDELDEPNFDARDDQSQWYNNIDHPHRDRIFRLLKAANVGTVLSGHIHCRRPEKVVDGIRFFRAPAAGGRPQFVGTWEDGDSTVGFHRLDVSDDRIDVTFIPIDPPSQAEQIGPRGHFYTNNHAALGFPDEYDYLLEPGHHGSSRIEPPRDLE